MSLSSRETTARLLNVALGTARSARSLRAVAEGPDSPQRVVARGHMFSCRRHFLVIVLALTPANATKSTSCTLANQPHSFTLLPTARQYFGDPIDCISRDDIPPNLLGKFSIATWHHATTFGAHTTAHMLFISVCQRDKY